MLRLLLRACPPGQRVPKAYGLVASDLLRHRHWIAPIPLNHLLRWALAVWMRLRNPVPPGDVDRLALRCLYSEAYRLGFRAGTIARYPPGTALVFTRPTRAMVAATFGIHADAEQLAERILTAAINSGPDGRNPALARR